MNFTLCDLEQRSQAWHEFRKDKIGASMVGAIMGVDPFRTRLQLWEDIIFGKQVEVNSAMQRGIDREQEALDWINAHSMIQYKPAVLQSIEYPWMIASLDGIDLRDPEYPNFIEIKWPNRDCHEQAKLGYVPDRYVPQVQFQMWMTGCQVMMYISCHGDEKTCKMIARDDEYIGRMIPQIIGFRHRIIDFMPPEPCDRDIVQINDSRLSEKAERYCQLDRLIAELEMERNDIRKDLIAESVHPRVAIGPVRLSKILRIGNIDYGAIPELKSVDLEKYRKSPIESWRVTYD